MQDKIILSIKSRWWKVELEPIGEERLAIGKSYYYYPMIGGMSRPRIYIKALTRQLAIRKYEANFAQFRYGNVCDTSFKFGRLIPVKPKLFSYRLK